MKWSTSLVVCVIGSLTSWGIWLIVTIWVLISWNWNEKPRRITAAGGLMRPSGNSVTWTATLTTGKCVESIQFLYIIISWLCRKVSRHELFPIRAPLLALEHCIQPFLDGCDADNDHFITLQEWGTCLELTEVKQKEFISHSFKTLIFGILD